jgi:hypothetical protein
MTQVDQSKSVEGAAGIDSDITKNGTPKKSFSQGILEPDKTIGPVNQIAPGSGVLKKDVSYPSEGFLGGGGVGAGDISKLTHYGKSLEDLTPQKIEDSEIKHDVIN